MTEVVVGNLMAHDESNLLICGAKFVETTREVNVTSRGCEGRYLFEPRNLDGQSTYCRPISLKAAFHSANPVDGPGRVFKSYRFEHLCVQPLSETLSAFELKVVSHCEVASNPCLHRCTSSWPLRSSARTPSRREPSGLTSRAQNSHP